MISFAYPFKDCEVCPRKPVERVAPVCPGCWLVRPEARLEERVLQAVEDALLVVYPFHLPSGAAWPVSDSD